MKTIRRNVIIDDDLGGKTLCFDFSKWTDYAKSSVTQYDLIVVDDTHKLYYERTLTSEYLYLKDGSEEPITIASRTFLVGFKSYYTSYTLSSDFGIVKSLKKTISVVYESIFIDIPLVMKFNNVDVEKVVFNGVEVDNIYFNNELIF